MLGKANKLQRSSKYGEKNLSWYLIGSEWWAENLTLKSLVLLEVNAFSWNFPLKFFSSLFDFSFYKRSSEPLFSKEVLVCECNYFYFQKICLPMLSSNIFVYLILFFFSVQKLYMHWLSFDSHSYLVSSAFQFCHFPFYRSFLVSLHVCASACTSFLT